MAKSPASRFDRKGKKNAWLNARNAETSYNSKLKKLARRIGDIIEDMAPDGTMKSAAPIIKVLNAYAKVIEPWAQSVATFMLRDVAARNEKAWIAHGEAMGKALRHTLRETPIGYEFQALLNENVDLITSLPRSAALRVQHQVQEGQLKSTRSSEIAKDILATGHVTESRARLIARTEVSRAAVTLTQVRAQALGSQGYIWRSQDDGRVRPEHKAMDGKYVRWDDPPSFPSEPTLGPYHAGCGPNCRCFPEPVLPDY